MRIKIGLSKTKSSMGSATALAAAAAGFFLSCSPVTAAIGPTGSVTSMSADVADLLGKAQRAIGQGHPEVALIYLKNAETVAPDIANIHLQMGQVLLSTNNPSEAERELNIALQKGTPEARVLPLIFQSMVAQHEGQMLLDRYPAPRPNDKSPLAIDTLRARAIAQIQIGKRDDAAASLDQALSIARNAQTLTARAQFAMDDNDTDSATKLVDESLSKDPNNVVALLLKVTVLQKIKQAAKALDYANTLVKIAHGQPVSLLTRAGVFLQLNQDGKADADIDAVLSVAPNTAAAIFYKAVIKERAKDSKGAWALAQTLPRSFLSSRPDIGVSISQMAVQAGQRETGADILHSTVESYPNDIEARIRLAALYLMLKEPINAQQILEPAKNSSDPRINALLAQTYAAQKNLTASLDYFQKASEAGYGGDALKLQLASADIQRGKYDDAIQLLLPLNGKQANRPEVAGPLITAYLSKGDTESAIKVAQALTKAAPNNAFGPYYEAQIAAQKGDTDAAIASDTSAIKRDGKFSPALFSRANLLVLKGDTAGAEADLRKVLAANPKYSIASLRLAELLEQSGDDDHALATLKAAATANPTDLLVCSTLEHFYATRKRWGEASATITTFLHSSPNNGSALALQAEIQLSTGAVDTAIKTLEALQKTYPHSQDISVLLARAYTQKGNKQAAHDTLARAVADEPKAPTAHIAIVDSDLINNNSAAALSEANAFMRDAPGPSAAQTLASVLAKQSKLNDAEDVLKKSLAASPDARTAIQLSIVLRIAGKMNAADNVLKSWLLQHPQDAAVRQLYATGLMTSNKQSAAQQLRQVLSSDPNNLGALNNLAWLLTDTDPEQANQFVQRALKIAPNYPSVLDTGGWVAWKLKQAPAAINMLRRAHAGAPSDPEIGYHLSVVLAASGKAAEAKKVLDATLAVSKDFEDRHKAEQLAIQLK